MPLLSLLFLTLKLAAVVDSLTEYYTTGPGNSEIILVDYGSSINQTHAKSYCNNNYIGHLISIKSPNTTNILTQLFSQAGISSDYWMGLERSGVDCSGQESNKNPIYWKWSSGEAFYDNYTNWLSNEPNNCNSKCVRGAASHEWRDTHCSLTYSYFVCQIYPTSSPTRTPTKIPSYLPSVTPTKNPSLNPSQNPTTHPSLSPTNSPTVTALNSYTNDWIINGLTNATHLNSSIDSIVYIHTICTSSSQYLTTTININTHFVKGFEFGFMHEKCVDYVQENVSINLGVGNNNWCSYSTGYSLLLSTGDIRYNNSILKYANVSNTNTNSTNFTMVVSFLNDTVEYFMDNVSLGKANNTKLALNLEDEFSDGIRTVLGAESYATGTIHVLDWYCNEDIPEISTLNTQTITTNKTACIEDICTTICQPNCTINGKYPVSSTISIADLTTTQNSSSFNSLDISMEGIHTFQSDLSMTLSHENVDLLLFTGIGRRDENFNFTLSDNGSSIMSSNSNLDCNKCVYTLPNNKSINNVFSGTSPIGDWILSIDDIEPDYDSGVFTKFCIESLCYYTSTILLPECNNSTCITHYWNFSNTFANTTEHYIIQDNNTYTGDHEVVITMKERVCDVGTVDILIASTDFDNVYEFVDISIGDELFSGCTSNLSSSCDINYSCVKSYSVGEINVGETLNIIFSFPLYRINKNQGCNNYSFKSNISLNCFNFVTFSPTIDTISPTKYPSKSPQNAPTSSPTEIPTNSPTVSPTNTPSLSPIRSPTDSPTNSPINSPTNSPTSSPTNSPTRNPTQSTISFDGYLTVIFELQNVSSKTLKAINEIDNTTEEKRLNNSMIKKLEEIIEKNYLIKTQDYTYSEFDVIITEINGLFINPKGQKYKNPKTSRKLLQTNVLPIGWEVWINKDIAETFKRATVSDSFEQGIVYDFSMYFSDWGTFFSHENSDTKVDYTKLDTNSTFIESVVSDKLLLINLLFLLCALVIQLLSILHVKCKWKYPNKTDHFKPKDFLIFALQVWDLFSDILFSRDVFKIYETKRDSANYTVICFGSVIFIVVPWILNLTHVVRESKQIQDLIEDNPKAKTWFRRKRNFLAWLVAATGGLYPSLRLVCSRMFGLSFLDFSLSSRELESFEGIKLKYTVLFENLPQFCLQLFFLAIEPSATQKLSTWLAIVSSVLSMLSVLLSYFMNKTQNKLLFSRYIITLDYSSVNDSLLVTKNYKNKSDFKQLYKNRFMQSKLRKNIISKCVGQKIDLEVVCVVIGEKTTQIVVDCGLTLTGKSLIDILNNKKIALQNCLRNSFNMQNNYPVQIRLSQKRWKIEQQNFVQKFLSQDLRNSTISNNNKSGISREQSISINGEKYMYTVSITKKNFDKKNQQQIMNDILSINSNEEMELQTLRNINYSKNGEEFMG